jgi:hypothetical protein
LARYDGELKAAREAGLGEVVHSGLLAAPATRLRQEAITCYLSASEGWQDAIRLLDGAFAPERDGALSKLTDGKAG